MANKSKLTITKFINNVFLKKIFVLFLCVLIVCLLIPKSILAKSDSANPIECSKAGSMSRFNH